MKFSTYTLARDLDFVRNEPISLNMQKIENFLSTSTFIKSDQFEFDRLIICKILNREFYVT